MTAVQDGALYAGGTAHHRHVDGHVLAGLVPKGRVLGVDADPSMLAVASAGGGGPSYAVARAQDLSLVAGWLPSQVLIAYDPALDAASRARFRAGAERRAPEELRRDEGTYDQDCVRLDLLAHRI